MVRFSSSRHSLYQLQSSHRTKASQELSSDFKSVIQSFELFFPCFTSLRIPKTFCNHGSTSFESIQQTFKEYLYLLAKFVSSPESHKKCFNHQPKNENRYKVQ